MKIFTPQKFSLKFALILMMFLLLLPSAAGAADVYEGNGLIVDIDNYIVDEALFSQSTDANASGGYSAEALVTNTSSASSTSAIEYRFTTDSSIVVNIWLRAKATKGSDDSVYASLDNESFKAIQLSVSSDGNYIWNKYKSEVTLAPGEHCIRLSPREKGARLDQIVITTLKHFIPSGICGEITRNVGTLESQWPTPQVTPTEGQHPRVYFTSDRKDEILANIAAPENALAVSKFNKFASDAITTSTDYNINTLAHIEAKALYSYLYDDENTRQQAIDAIDLIAQMKPNMADNLGWRRYGEMIQVLAEIYDWCYEDLTSAQKEEIIILCAEFAANTEIGWPPSKQTAVNGHGSEFQFLRDIMAFAIAVYDERPDIWNYVGGRFYAEFVPVRQFRLQGQYNLQGTNYGYYRTEADAYAYALITGMGAPEPYSGENLAGTGYSELYFKRPDGRYLNDGDMYESNILPAAYRTNEKDGMLIKSSATSDGILKGEYFRRSLSSANGRITQTLGDNSPVMQIILSDPSVEVESFHTIPKSRYFSTPAGIMVARTSWEEGRNSDTVLAMMKIGEYYYSNHQHQDSGTFQIYYKGLLAGKGGKYDLYGTDEHNMYTSKTISHNGLLIYDPSEDNGTNTRQNVNDGGQRFENITTEPLEFGQVLAHEIDPGNTIDPAYTYIKGDVADAYSDKVSEVQRSMMFLNLGIEGMPAAFITFDRITSADETFKKTWVLHGTQAPRVEGNRAVFTAKPSNEGDEVGVMTVDTLLPASTNMESAVYGSAEDGFGIVNSWEYDASQGKWQITKSVNYMPGTDEKDEVNTRRLEISPRTPALEDSFLNVMFIGDNEANEKAFLLENTTHYGASFMDKAVFFGKTSNKNTSFRISSSKTYDYIICDMAKGTYSVTDANGTQIICASEEGGVLSFTASGSVSVTKTGDDYNAPEDNAVVPADRLYTKNGTNFALSVPGGENADAEEFLSLYGYRLVKKSDKYTIYNEDTVIAQFGLNDKTAVTSEGIFTFTNPPTEVDGVLRIHSDDLLNLLFDNSVYCDYAKIIFAPAPTGKSTIAPAGPEAYVVSSGNTTVADFTADGQGTYVMKSVIGGNYSHAGNTVYRYGTGGASEHIVLSEDATNNRFSKDKIYRFSSTLTVNAKPTGFSFGSFYYKNGSSLVYPSSVNGLSHIPEAGETVTVDSIVDLNTLTSYYYVNNVFAGSHNLYDNLYKDQILTDATALKFGNTLVYVAYNNVTAPGVELFTVTDVKRTEYPAGTAIEDVQEEVTDVYYERKAVPETIMAWRYTVTPKDGEEGVYNINSKHSSSFNGSVVLPIDTVIDASDSGYVRGTVTITPKVNMYYTANKLSVVRYEDSTKIGDDQFSVPAPLAIPSLGTTPVKFDAVVNKATGEAKFYINGKYAGANTYTSSDPTKTLTAKYLGVYIGTTVVPIDTVVAEISNAKVYNYPDFVTYADIENEIIGDTGIYTEVITPKQRGNVNTVGNIDGTHFVSKATAGVSEAANTMVQLSEPAVFGTTTDKYIVLTNKVKFIKHTNDFSYVNAIFSSGGTRINSDAFALQQGDEYTAKAIVDVANNKVRFYMNNFFVSEKDINTADVSYLATFMNNYDDEKDGMSEGEVEFSVTDTYANHYTIAYSGTLDDVIAAEIGENIENCSLRTVWYSEYADTDNKSEEIVANNYRLALIANNFNTEEYKCIVAGYKLDEVGNEILAFTKQIIKSNYIYDAIPKDFDVLKVFLWDISANPIMKTYYPTKCRR